MKVARHIVLALSSLLASGIVTAVLVMGIIAFTVGLDTPVSIPFVVTNNMGEGTTMTHTQLEFPGALIVMVALATVIYLLSVRLSAQRQRQLSSVSQFGAATGATS